MARSFWKGVISFGLVAIPVKMYVAAETQGTDFHLLHKKCLTRPRQTYYCASDNEYIGLKDTVRGYEYAKDQYIVLDDKDFEKVPVRTTHTVEITSFVDFNEIDPVYFYGSHYIEPEQLAAKPFSLLREVLEKSKKAGIAKVTFQRREHLCAIRPLDHIMALHTMHYQDEIIPRDDLYSPDAKISPQEMKMAMTLVDNMSGKFNAAAYKDEYQGALKKVIEAKLQGLEIKAPKAKIAEVKDLMEAIRASIEATSKKNAEPVPVRPKK
jgi:DNA end-binding protein Ku